MTYSPEQDLFLHNDPAAEAAAAAKLEPPVRALFESNDHAAVEGLFLDRIESTPSDLPFFIPILRHYIRNNKTDIAETLLQFLWEAAEASADGEIEQSLLRALLSIWPGYTDGRDRAIAALRTRYRGSPNLDKLLAEWNIREASDPLAALRQCESWLRYDVGRGVYLATRGIGRVREINLSMNAIRVVFVGSASPVSFKPDEAHRLLELLGPGHLLLDMLDNLDGLKALARQDKGELLRRLFSSMNRRLTTAQVKELLAPVVPAQEWSSFWTQAKQDRRLTVTVGNLCSWNDSTEAADAALLEEFTAAAPRRKMDLAKKHAKRSSALAQRMADLLAQEAAICAGSDPSLALELYCAIDRLPGPTAETPIQQIHELLRHDDTVALLSGIQDRTIRRQAISLYRETSDQWARVYAGLLTVESDSPIITMLYDALNNNEGTATQLKRLLDDIVSSPSKAPALFLWLCTAMPARGELGTYMNWSLLQTIMLLLANDTIKQYNAALRRLFDENGLVESISRTLDRESAQIFITLLERDSALEEHRRERLLGDLRSFVSPVAGDTQSIFYVTAKALAQRQEEFMKITTVDIPQNTEEIVKARAHGDLRENFEYHAARARQEMLSSRAKTLHDELQFARPLDPAAIDGSVIAAGTTVVLAPADGGDPMTVTLLGPWDSDPDNNIFSYQTKLAEQLLGRKQGDIVEFNGKQHSIDRITVWENRGHK
ncbi:MAG: GreA/GreB family elongation factor [Chitinispirillaceae bacterium]|nr:GreA/GreB family elongation factor [Chitinispirillaceae bacterium]